MFIGHHALIAEGPTVQGRDGFGEFAAAFPAKHELSRAWGVSRGYATELKRQLKGKEAFSDVAKKKKRISVIDDPQLAALVYTGEREYSRSARADDGDRVPYGELSEDDKKAWEAKARERAGKQVIAREEIVRLLDKNGSYSFQMLANELKFCGKDTIRRWFFSFETSEIYPERIIPLLSEEQ